MFYHKFHEKTISWCQVDPQANRGLSKFLDLSSIVCPYIRGMGACKAIFPTLEDACSICAKRGTWGHCMALWQGPGRACNQEYGCRWGLHPSFCRHRMTLDCSSKLHSSTFYYTLLPPAALKCKTWAFLKFPTNPFTVAFQLLEDACSIWAKRGT